MTALHQYISAVGSFQGVLLFFLLVCDKNTSAASKVLGLYCLTMGLAFFLPFISFGVTPSVFHPLAAWLFFVPVMYGPLLYLYCKKVVFNAPLTTSDLVHLTPLIVCYALNYDSLLFWHEGLRLWINGAAAPTQRLWLSEFILFVVPAAYLLATAVLIVRYFRRAENTLSNFDPAVFKWLGLLIGSFIGIFVLKGVMAFSNIATMTMLVVSDALIVLIILLIALTQWRYPRFFEVAQTEQTSGNPHSLASNQSSDVGAIDSEVRSIMYETLIDHMQREQSYRDRELSLTKLAQLTGLSPHHLSEVLNQYAGKNFNQFVNEYRVKEVCEQLNASNTTPVLDLALKAGFASKSTFNTIFKKLVGMTPTQYRLQRNDQ
ncbi:hypothetical protein GCM10008090_33610 [Arenicella chitinivorans]|uniref:HTH araC/xylS-type domain-containing protein n=1 Tax=Arenicella chitinivorans TaxID=1329800 RepID=A0A918S3G9_9GAMM|nr:helix-turn-helix domain-containing protein [Arenicella chitinivorans]GHA20957.1 hypothetical protein GCM10008090_33610 [Arenicella chitinivorans]